ncbi:LCP family protein [Actinomyces sp. B33]|uniref:LCP family protein n=1 Tax=Actinomyces sp. B33 TaxID=2942131 RepID=UPI00233F94A7|nr:LCP family protein [Actinomyces sp. B33]MDC4232627.1 LCP family protein [Actinomyces sp. B33]
MSPTPPSFAPDPKRRRPPAPQGAGQDRSSAPREHPAPEQGPEALPPSHEPAARQWRIPVDRRDRPRAAGGLAASDGDAPQTAPPSFAPQRASVRARGDHSIALSPSVDSPSTRSGSASGSGPQQMPPAYAPQRRQPPPAGPVPAHAPARGAGRPSGAPAPRPAAARPQWAPVSAAGPRPARRRRRPGRAIIRLLVFAVVLVVAWGGFLFWDVNANLGRTRALSGEPGTDGTTYLLAGSDSRADGAVQDGFEGGERSDSIMLVNIAPNGQAVAVSIPRDAYAEIPGYGWDKINSSYAYGGSRLLVESVERLSGLTVDHYVQIGMGGVSDIVDAVDGVELCYDSDVDDPLSGLTWTAGCSTVDGATALAFSRMRYSDPEGDIGRTKRQRQVISQVVGKAMSPSTLLNPARTLRVERAGSSAFTVDEDSSALDVARLVLAFRSAAGAQMMGTPPIETIDFTTDDGASAVLLVDETAPEFFAALRAGTLTPGDLNRVG